MEPNEIQKKLAELQKARERMLKDLNESEAVIEAIEDKIGDLQRRQLERMSADHRIDNRIVDQVRQGSETGNRKRQAIQKGGFIEIIMNPDGTKDEIFRNTDTAVNESELEADATGVDGDAELDQLTADGTETQPVPVRSDDLP